MATQTRLAFITLGVPTTAASTVTIFGSGQAGTVGAQRILTHPDGVNFAAINYYKNPTRTTNLDNAVLPAPSAEAILTLGSRQVVRFDRLLGDVVVTEVWEGAQGSQAAMPTFLFRQLYEYLINPPVFNPSAQTFVVWEPRDRTLIKYNVQLYQLRVGAGSGRSDDVFDIDDVRLPDSVEIKHPLESLDVSPTGLITRDVTVKLRVVSVAA